MSASLPTLAIESEYDGIIVAIDEVGRGPWAGPVVACATVLDVNGIPDGIRDSKQLSRTKRETLFDAICSSARTSIGLSTVREIEELNIFHATMQAMCRAYEGLGVDATVALIDGNHAPKDLPCPTRCVVKGDAISLSIAAASIVAKVTRDRMMAELAQEHPGYGWETNVGYGTREHQEGIRTFGLTPHHRRNWGPIRAILDKTEKPQLTLLNA